MMELNTFEFKKNARVYTSDQKEVGHVDRVVIDPKTKRVSHVVIRKGRLFAKYRVMPINLIANATEDEVILKAEASEVKALPRFEETRYVRMFDDGAGSSAPSSDNGFAPSLYGYPTTPVSSGAGEGRYVKQVEQNIPEGTVALKEGAKVITEDGHTAGQIEEVLADPGTRQATHIVVSKGLLTKEQKLVPTFWIRLFGEEEIHLAAPANVLDKLQPYPA